jgi:hypothetical protein
MIILLRKNKIKMINRDKKIMIAEAPLKLLNDLLFFVDKKSEKKNEIYVNNLLYFYEGNFF